jgi:uncharacterized protein
MRRIGSIRNWVMVCAMTAAVPCCVVPCFGQDTGTAGTEKSASPVKKYKAAGYVNDFAEIIDPKVQLEIDAVCTELQKNGNAQMAIVTVKSLEGMTIKDFSTELFNKWGVGPKDTNRGVMVLLSVGDRKWRITTGAGLESVLTEEEAAQLGGEMVPMLKKGDYGEALLYAAKKIRDKVMKEKIESGK